MYPRASRFRKEVGERFIIALRKVYERHPFYNYHNDPEEGNMMIELSYSNSHYDGKYPRFTIKVGSYNKDLTDMLASNMSEPVYENGILVGYKRRKIIRVPITVIVHANAEEECSDLSDELSDIVLVFDKHNFSSKGIVPVGVHVSETDLFDNEQEVYQNTVTFTVDVPWVYSETSNHKLDGFDVEGSSFDWCSQLVNTATPLEYRQPGIDVWKEYAKNPKGFE